MNLNYYEILEVNKNASPEIIEKAYKTLVKKYHPDLQDSSFKKIYEEKLKLVNEAYDILSNDKKRAVYNITLQDKNISKDDYDNLYKENQSLKSELNRIKSTSTQKINKDIVYEENYYDDNNDYQRNISDAVSKAYHDAYIQDLKNRGYKIRYKKTFKDYLALLLTILVVTFILFICWLIPPVQNFMITFYKENIAIQFVVNIIKSLF